MRKPVSYLTAATTGTRALQDFAQGVYLKGERVRGMEVRSMADSRTSEGLRAYIRELRKLRGYTQEHVARECNIPKRTYASYETGETKEMKAGPLARVTAYLGGTLEDLVQVSEDDVPAERGIYLAQRRRGLIADDIPADGLAALSTADLLNEVDRRMDEARDARNASARQWIRDALRWFFQGSP